MVFLKNNGMMVLDMGVFENRISGMQKMTLLDYPTKVAAILFYNGCFVCKCPYCYNVGIWYGKGETMKADAVRRFLNTRKGVLDAIVFSGGECTIHGNKLLEDMRYVKSKGYLVKVDTNGTNPNLVKRMIEEGIVDFIALDIKCPEYKRETFFTNPDSYFKFLETLETIKESGITWETRTTVHPDVITEEDVNEIQKFVKKTCGENHTHHLQFFFRDEKAEYLNPTLNRDPRMFDMAKVEHIVPLELRNEKENVINLQNYLDKSA